MPEPEASWSPLELDALRESAGPAWAVTLLPSVDSTNAAAARDPHPGTVVVADHQSAGRGRLDRIWETPPGTALTFSAVVDPGVGDADWPLLPLAVALAVADGVHRATGLTPEVKWPNDLLLPVDGAVGKIAGILLERVRAADGDRALAVVGVGINVGMTPEQFPVPTATSLAAAGSAVERTVLFGHVIRALSAILAELAAAPPRVLERYRAVCSTLGRTVEAHLPDGTVLTGTASDVDVHGRLVVAGVPVGAGDVLHVRTG